MHQIRDDQFDLAALDRKDMPLPAFGGPSSGYDHDKYRRPLHAAGIPTRPACRGELRGSELGKT
jgi:hypothetical protein